MVLGPQTACTIYSMVRSIQMTMPCPSGLTRPPHHWPLTPLEPGSQNKCWFRTYGHFLPNSEIKSNTAYNKGNLLHGVVARNLSGSLRGFADRIIIRLVILQGSKYDIALWCPLVCANHSQSGAYFSTHWWSPYCAIAPVVINGVWWQTGLPCFVGSFHILLISDPYIWYSGEDIHFVPLWFCKFIKWNKENKQPRKELVFTLYQWPTFATHNSWPLLMLNSKNVFSKHLLKWTLLYRSNSSNKRHSQMVV